MTNSSMVLFSRNLGNGLLIDLVALGDGDVKDYATIVHKKGENGEPKSCGSSLINAIFEYHRVS